MSSREVCVGGVGDTICLGLRYAEERNREKQSVRKWRNVKA